MTRERPAWSKPGKRRLTMQRWPMRWEAYQHMIRARSPRTRKRTVIRRLRLIEEKRA